VRATDSAKMHVLTKKLYLIQR